MTEVHRTTVYKAAYHINIAELRQVCILKYFQLQLHLISHPNLDLVFGSFIWMMSSVMVLSQNLLIVPICEWEFIIGVLKMQELYVLTQVRILLLTSVKVMNIECPVIT